MRYLVFEHSINYEVFVYSFVRKNKNKSELSGVGVDIITAWFVSVKDLIFFSQSLCV